MSASRLVVLDHSFHEKTKSSTFFIEAWKAAGFEVFLLFDHSWEGGGEVQPEQIDALEPSLVVSWQILKPAAYYRRLRCRRLLLVPMYDSASGMKDQEWIEYWQFAFLHFSRRLYNRLHRLGISGYFLQYFPDPHSLPAVPFDLKRNGVFFWQRRTQITLSTVQRLASRVTASSRPVIHRHRSPDPGQSTEPVDPGLAMELVETEWFPETQDLLQTVAGLRFFLAPRLKEGIGMSFLEAFCMGCVVIGHRDATMDEYLRSGENGVLLDLERPQEWNNILSFDWRKLSEQAIRDTHEGYSRYREHLDQLILGKDFWFTARPRWTIFGILSLASRLLRTLVLRPVKRALQGGVSRRADQP